MKTKFCILLIAVLLLNTAAFSQDNTKFNLGGLLPFSGTGYSPLPSDNILSWNGRAFGYCAFPSPYFYGKFFLNTPYSWTITIPDPGSDFVSAGCFSPDGLYCIKFTSSYLFKIDTTLNTTTLVAVVPGISGNFSGLAYDWTSNTMYATTVWNNMYSQLYTINLNNGVCTPVGYPMSAMIIDIACSNSGQLYGVNILNDNFCSINKTNGTVTYIGYIGFDAAYAQGMSWDHTTDSCFYASLRVPANVGELRRVNIQTGATTVIGSFGSVTEVDGFAIPGAPAPSSPVLYSPSNVSIVIQPLTFKWYKSLSATNYAIQIATDSLFVNIALSDTTLTDTVKIVSGLPSNTWYYWRARAKNIYGNGPWSAAWKFAPVNAAPSAPILSYPANNSYPVMPLDFKWYKTNWASGYWFQVSTDSIFANIVCNDSAISDTTTIADNLVHNTVYYWRLKAKNIFGFGPWSPVWRFTPGNMPSVPVLYYPFEDSAASQPVTFKWFAGQYATSYGIQISLDKYFNNIVINDSMITDTFRTYSNMQVNTAHYWRVNARNLFSVSAWSPYRKFIALTVGVSESELNVPDNYCLFQNYPNPFNPSTKISYGIPIKTFVTLKVYEISGKELVTLFNGLKTPGYYSVNFSAPDLPSGIYFCRLTAGGFTSTKKMVLIK